MHHSDVQKSFFDFPFQVYAQLFGSAAPVAADANPLHVSLFKSCWLMFLYARERTGCTDLVPGFLVLVSCLEVILGAAGEAIHTELHQQHGSASSTKEILCMVAGCSADDNMVKANQDVAQVVADLVAGGRLTGPANALFTDEHLQRNLTSLRNMAPPPSLPGGADGVILLEAFELVGLMRPSEFQAAAAAGSSQGTSAHVSESTHNGHANNDLLKTPERPTRAARPGSVPPVTPITRALRSHEWLDSFVADQSASPSAALASFFTACSHGTPADLIQQHVQDAESRLLESVKGQSCERESLRTSQAGTRLYFKALLHILQREEKRLGTRDFSVLLKDEGMHRALLAVCHEIAAHAYQSHTRPHPAVQRALGVTCFDLLVMIENFLRDFEVCPCACDWCLRRVFGVLEWWAFTSCVPVTHTHTHTHTHH